MSGDEPLFMRFAERQESFRMDFNELNTVGGGGITKWSQLLEKPFERIGETLAVVDGTLDVNIHEVHNDAGGLTTIIG